MLSVAGVSLAGAVVHFIAYQRRRDLALLHWARVMSFVAVTLVAALVGWFTYLVLGVTEGSS